MRRLLVTVLAVGCGTRAPRPTDDRVQWARSGIDWTKPPLVASPVRWTAPTIREAVLPNGIRIVVAENRRLPLVSMGVMHGAAGSREDGELPGLASITLETLDETLGNRHEDAGIRLETAIATDHALQQLTLPTRALDTAFDVLATTIRKPDLEKSYREMERRQGELERRIGQDRRLAAQLFDRVVFGDHPYAEPAEGTYNGIAHIDEVHVRAFWERAYRPDATTIVVAGDTTVDAVRAQVQRTLGDWKRPTSPVPTPRALPAYTPKLLVVDRANAAETFVIVGGRAPGAGDGEQLAAAVANLIIGGGEDGRIDQELHGALGITVGASASFWRGVAGGSWGVSATFGVANTGKGIRALLALLETARTTTPTVEELDRARRALMSGTRNGFETTSSSARALERLVAQRLPLDRFATLEARLGALKPDDLRDVLPLRDLSIVVIGDWEKLKGELSTLGLPVTQHDP